MPPEIWEYIKTLGPVGVVLALEGVAGARGLWGFAVAHNAQIAVLVKQIADLQARIEQMRNDHAAEIAQMRAAWAAELVQVRADKDKQIAREAARVDSTWTRLDHLTDYLDAQLAASQQIARAAGALVNGSAESGPASPPAGPPAPPPSTRRSRS